jgi:hypothetical protein
VVSILLGTTGDVATANNQLWGQDHAGITDVAETNDHFGASLAIGSYGNGDRYDLVIGVPDEDVGTIANAGAINIIYGGATTLSTSGQKLLHQNAIGVPDNAEANDGFGKALSQGG